MTEQLASAESSVRRRIVNRSLRLAAMAGAIGAGIFAVVAMGAGLSGGVDSARTQPQTPEVLALVTGTDSGSTDSDRADSESAAALPILSSSAEPLGIEDRTFTTIGAAGSSDAAASVSALARDLQADTGAEHLTRVATAILTEGTVAVWSEPDTTSEPAWSLPVPTEFGGPRHFRVIGEQGDWLEVDVPVRPNGSTGWIPRSAVSLDVVTTRITVDLSDREVTVWDGDEIVMSATGTIGRDATPTPTGNFYIRDSFPWYADSVYGPWVMALSAYSESIDQINGGNAVVALHGTVRPDQLGAAASLGCVRLDNETILALSELVDVGTPVEIVD